MMRGRDCRVGLRAAFQVHVIPCQRPKFLGSGSDEEREDDVGVHRWCSTEASSERFGLVAG